MGIFLAFSIFRLVVQSVAITIPSNVELSIKNISAETPSLVSMPSLQDSPLECYAYTRASRLNVDSCRNAWTKIFPSVEPFPVAERGAGSEKVHPMPFRWLSGKLNLSEEHDHIAWLEFSTRSHFFLSTRIPSFQFRAGSSRK